MNFLENDLEEIICSSDKELLEESGLYIEGGIKRQLRIGRYGIADIVTFERDYDEYSLDQRRITPILNVTIYELKKDKIGISAYLQAVGYAKGIQRYLEKRNFYFDVRFTICLIGKSIDTHSTFSYLVDLLPTYPNGTVTLQCITYKYTLKGIKFVDEFDYKLNEEGF